MLTAARGLECLQATLRGEEPPSITSRRSSLGLQALRQSLIARQSMLDQILFHNNEQEAEAAGNQTTSLLRSSRPVMRQIGGGSGGGGGGGDGGGGDSGDSGGRGARLSKPTSALPPLPDYGSTTASKAVTFATEELPAFDDEE
jgi:hypothetical protein